jgi:hypothetical protein
VGSDICLEPREFYDFFDAIFVIFMSFLQLVKGKGKGKSKAILLQVWTVPEGSRRMRLPDAKTLGT